MPDAEAVLVAEAVAAQIATSQAAGSFIENEFTIKQSWGDWRLELKKASNLRVDVFPAQKKKPEPISRDARIKYTTDIAVAVRQRFYQSQQDDDTGELLSARIKVLSLLTQQIYELFVQERLTAYESAVFEGEADFQYPYLPHLADLRQFTGIVKMTIQSDRQA